MVEIGLSDNLPNLCRLCLQVDDFIVDIFHRLESNQNKAPLPERIYELYQVKVGKSDGLPTNICHRCLYFTESFTEFRTNVRKCEARLQNYVASIGILGSAKLSVINLPRNGIKMEQVEYTGIEEYSDILPDENSLVTVVDPNQDYDSSDDSFSIDSDNEYGVQQAPPPMDMNKMVVDNDSNTINNYHFVNSENLDNSEGIKNVYLCQYCDMAFTAQIECAEHESRHDAANPHSCNFCPFRCSSRQIVIAHIKELHHNDRPYVCVQCNKGFGRRSDLKKHTIVHTGIRPFTCPVCNKNFSRNTNLTKHLRIHTGLKPHVCQKCPRSFTTTADLVRHQRVHNDFKPFQCPKCPSAFTRKDKLLHHERMHLRKEQQTSTTTLCNNTIDSIGTTSNDGFDAENMVISLDPFSDLNQVESHDQIPPQNILEPPKVFNKPLVSLETVPPPPTEHITGDVASNEHNFLTKQYSCDDCPKKFTKASTLLHHRNAHKGNNRNHVCPVCSKAFLRKRELQRHSVIHTGIKPFACQICHKRFNRKDKVVRHERIHNEERFPCVQCKMEFQKQELLDTHLKLHEIEKQQEFEHTQMMLNDTNLIPFQLQDGFMRPQLNFYSELKSEFTEE